MDWVGRDLKDHIAPPPLPWARTPSTRLGCSKPHPTWPWTLPVMRHPQLRWATVPHHPYSKEFLPNINLNLLFQLEAITPCPVTKCPCKNPLSSFRCWKAGPFRHWKAAIRSPHSLLFSRMNNPNSLSLSSQEGRSIPLSFLWPSSGLAPIGLCPSCAEGSRAGYKTAGGVSAERSRGWYP